MKQNILVGKTLTDVQIAADKEAMLFKTTERCWMTSTTSTSNRAS